MLNIFTDLLDYTPPPRPLRTAHHKINGKLTRTESGRNIYGPFFIYSRGHHTLKLMDRSLNPSNNDDVQTVQDIIDGKAKAPIEGIEVFSYLMESTVKKHLAR